MRNRLAIALSLLCLTGPAYALDPSPIAHLAESEQEYYEKVFDYAMATLKADSKYDWQSNVIRGTITAHPEFVSKSRSRCRNYNEIFVISGQETNHAGIACQRQGEGEEGWCRLKQGDALTCALEPPDNIVDESLKDAGGVLNDGKDALAKMKGLVQ